MHDKWEISGNEEGDPTRQCQWRGKLALGQFFRSDPFRTLNGTPGLCRLGKRKNQERWGPNLKKKATAWQRKPREGGGLTHCTTSIVSTKLTTQTKEESRLSTPETIVPPDIFILRNLRTRNRKRIGLSTKERGKKKGLIKASVKQLGRWDREATFLKSLIRGTQPAVSERKTANDAGKMT